jgi:hypothetical protein
MTNGATTAIVGPIGVRAQVGDVIRLAVTTVNGIPTLTLYQNGATLIQCVDLANTYPTGAPGMGMYASAVANAEISNWAGGNSTYVISGNAGVAGAMVAYSGASSGSVTADGAGYYAIYGLIPGSYTVTPSKIGYAFSPGNSSQTITNAIIGNVNFTATLIVGGQVSPFLVGP